MVYGSIIDGIFDGKIHSQDGVYYVEKATKYFADNTTTAKSHRRNPFHSIIYKEAHVVDPYEEHRTGIWLRLAFFFLSYRLTRKSRSAGIRRIGSSTNGLPLTFTYSLISSALLSLIHRTCGRLWCDR